MRMRKELLFDFDFEKIKVFLLRLVQPEEKIAYLDYVIKKYSENTPISYDLLTMLRLERGYWRHVKDIIGSVERLKSDKDDENFVEELVTSGVFKLDYKERDMFNLNMEKMMEYAEGLNGMNSRIYTRWVLKEAVIRLLDIQIEFFGLSRPISVGVMNFLLKNMMGILGDE